VSLDSLDDIALDGVLSSGLSALAPDIEPVDLWLDDLRPRFQRARTRRRVVRASGALVAFLVFGAFAFAFAQGPSMRRSHVTVESHSREPQATRGPKHTTTSRQPQSTTTAAPTTLPASTNPPPGSSSALRVGVPPGTAGTSAPPPGSAPPAQGSQPTVAPSQTRAFESFGGSISVRLDGGRLTLVQVSPTKGNHADVRVRLPRHVDVSFLRKGHVVSRIDVVVRNGRMVRIPHATAAQDDANVTLGSASHMSSASRSPGHQTAFEAVRALPAARHAVKAHASKPHPAHVHLKNRHSGVRGTGNV